TPQTASCPGLEPWLSRVSDALTQVQSLGAAATSGDLSTLNADVVSQAAADVSSLTVTLTAEQVPAPAQDADELVNAALATYTTGLQTIANAVANGDADQLAQGRSLLADGNDQIAIAREALNTLATDCPAT